MPKLICSIDLRSYKKLCISNLFGVRLYSECLKSKLVSISDSSVVSQFQTLSEILTAQLSEIRTKVKFAYIFTSLDHFITLNSQNDLAYIVCLDFGQLWLLVLYRFGTWSCNLDIWNPNAKSVPILELFGLWMFWFKIFTVNGMSNVSNFQM